VPFTCYRIFMGRGALDGDIVGGKLGASVYKESLDLDGLTQDCDIAGIVYPIPDPVHWY
jgi:hypothetical protein